MTRLRSSSLSWSCRRAGAVTILLGLALTWQASHAHDVPFSWLDLRPSETGLAARLTAHKVDIAHELALANPDSLFDPKFLTRQAAPFKRLLADRLLISADGRPLEPELMGAEVVLERQAVALNLRYPWNGIPGALEIRCRLFPYDPKHETFLSVYEHDQLQQQEIFTGERSEATVFTGGRQGVQAVMQRFIAAGVHHIFIGPDHILFIIGLLMLGGGLLRLLKIVTAFTIAHSITLALATLDILNPSPSFIEPAIALSIVYVGVNNLWARPERRDTRALIAFAFGFVHGFGFAGVLRELGLPRQALGWSLFAFNLGVEIGQACIVGAVAPLLAVVRLRAPRLGSQIVTGGSVAVVLAGGYWFFERVLALRG